MAQLDAAAFPALRSAAYGEPQSEKAAAAPAAWVSSWGGGGSTALKGRLAHSEPTAAGGKHKGISAAGMLQPRSQSNHPDVSNGALTPWVDTGEQAFVHGMLLLIRCQAQASRAKQPYMPNVDQHAALV